VVSVWWLLAAFLGGMAGSGLADLGRWWLRWRRERRKDDTPPLFW
jgi:hypothetical protein